MAKKDQATIKDAILEEFKGLPSKFNSLFEQKRLYVKLMVQAFKTEATFAFQEYTRVC